MPLILLDKFSFNKVIIVMYILFYAQIYSHKYFFTYYKGYSVYADGFIEQWGKDSAAPINLYIEYTNASSFIVDSGIGMNKNASIAMSECYYIYSNSKLSKYNNSENYSIYWRTIGY